MPETMLVMYGTPTDQARASFSVPSALCGPMNAWPVLRRGSSDPVVLGAAAP
jgi:hypothetical protein